MKEFGVTLTISLDGSWGKVKSPANVLAELARQALPFIERTINAAAPAEPTDPPPPPPPPRIVT